MVSKSQMYQLRLEAIPQLLTDSAKHIGFSSDTYKFFLVDGLDPEVWFKEFPDPVAAVLFLYQIQKGKHDFI